MSTQKHSALVKLTLTTALALAFVILAVPSLAFAEEETEVGINILIPKMSEFIPALIAFIIIFVVFQRAFWPRCVGILEKREETIKNNLDEAEAAKIEAQRTLEEYKQQLVDARHEAANIIDEARHAGEQVKADIVTQAQAQADETVAKAKKSIEKEREAAAADLQASLADMSLMIAGRFIGEDLTDEDQRKLIEKYVNEAGVLDAN